jgi:hypothetical protein
MKDFQATKEASAALQRKHTAFQQMKFLNFLNQKIVTKL